jgi:hypothetical protein
VQLTFLNLTPLAMSFRAAYSRREPSKVPSSSFASMTVTLHVVTASQGPVKPGQITNLATTEAPTQAALELQMSCRCQYCPTSQASAAT